MTWTNPRWNSLTGPDADTLRQIFESLSQFLANPTFNDGVNLGDGSTPTYDPVLDVVVQPPTTPVDSETFAALDADLSQLQTDLDDAQAEIDAILPIETTDISDDAITTPKLAANAVTAGKIAANTITANEIAADAITTNELAADSVTASELAAINLAVGKFLRSTSYTAGVSGWSIDADGNAEFNEISARGEIVTENTGAGRSAALTDGRLEVDGAVGDPWVYAASDDGDGNARLYLSNQGSAVQGPLFFTFDAVADEHEVAFNNVRDLRINGDDLLGAWTDWTPVLTADTSPPTMFAANRTGRVMKIGRTVIAQFDLRWTNLGSGEGTGSGLYTITLPYQATARPTYTNLGSAGFHHVGVRQYIGYPALSSTTTFIIYLDGGNNYNSGLGQINGSFASGTLVYEAAS